MKKAIIYIAFGVLSYLVGWLSCIAQWLMQNKGFLDSKRYKARLVEQYYPVSEQLASEYHIIYPRQNGKNTVYKRYMNSGDIPTDLSIEWEDYEW